MEPVTLIAAALALGATEGARETARTAVTDAYAAVKSWIATRYRSVSADVDGLEQDPDEELRRKLLAKKLAEAGADEDTELYELAVALMSSIEDHNPGAPARVGVHVRRAAVGGNVEVTDVVVDDGVGVIAEDVTAYGSVKIDGVTARRSSRDSYSSTGPAEAGGQTFTAQKNVNVGRDNITNVTIGSTPSAGNSGGRIRAVTAGAERLPIGQNIWKVTVNNGTSGPITDLDVDVYCVDESGACTDADCLPAKDKVSLRELYYGILSEGMGGTLDAISHRAQSTYPASLLGGAQLGNLGAYGPMFASQIANSPQVSSLLHNAQQQMIDRFPRVIPAGQAAEVLFVANSADAVHADVQFADEMGDLWVRRFGENPEPILQGDD